MWSKIGFQGNLVCVSNLCISLEFLKNIVYDVTIYLFCDIVIKFFPTLFLLDLGVLGNIGHVVKTLVANGETACKTLNG